MKARSLIFLFLFPALFFVAGGDALATHVGSLTHHLFHQNDPENCEPCVRFAATVKTSQKHGLALFQILKLEAQTHGAPVSFFRPEISSFRPSEISSFLDFFPQPPTPPPNLLV